MSKRTLSLLLLVGLPLSFLAGIKCQKTLAEVDQIGEPSITVTKFQNEKIRDTVYLVKKRWGLTGDHQIFALTKAKPGDNLWMPDTLSDLIWKGENTIFYRSENDTIKIFTLHLPDKKQELRTKQVIQINKINGEEFHNLSKQVDTQIKVLE